MQTLDSAVFRSRVEDFQSRHETKLVTMLFSDVIGSTHLKASLGEQVGIRAMLTHHEVVRRTLAAIPEGEEIGTAGDSFFLAFTKPSDAVKFALSMQRNVRQLAGETGHQVLDRIGIHVGEVWVDHTDTGHHTKDLYGLQVDLCARVASLAEADQILLTRFPFDSARQVLSRDELEDYESLSWLNHGGYLMKGIEEPIEICEVGETGKARLGLPADSEKAARAVSSDAEPVLGWRPAAGQAVPETSWILDGKLGEGAFGEVWSGHDKVMKTRHVFKFCFRAERARSLKREATIFRLLKERVGNHPNIIAIENVYFDHPPFYLVMEYINGWDLAIWFHENKVMPGEGIEMRLRLIAQVADAVQAAHDTGIVHRDIKPSNILVSGTREQPRAYLTDFGIGNISLDVAGTKLFGFTQTVTRSVAIGGTQLYMAPELFGGQPPSIRSDIYSLGVVLFQILVGDFTTPVSSDWPGEINDPLLREDLQLCFARDPLKRFAGAGELAMRLRSLAKRRTDREDALARQRVEEERKQAILVEKENRRYWTKVVLTAAVEAPAVAAVLGFMLHYTDDPSGQYDFASAFHIPNYLYFITLIAMYFGLDSGMRAYFRDLAVGFTSAKKGLFRYLRRLCGAVSGIIALQTAAVVIVGNGVLEIRGMFVPYFWFMFLVAFGGAAVGLLAASLVKSREAGTRVIFLIILSQLFLGGALIKYGDMNRDLDLRYSFSRWFSTHPEAVSQWREDARLQIPFVARLFPSHYGYEALVVAQAKLNPLTLRQDRLRKLIADLVQKGASTPGANARLEDLKESLALLTSLESGSVPEVERRLDRLDAVIAGKPLDVGGIKSRTMGVTAERLYTNIKIADLVARAELEANDYRRNIPANVFFSPEKRYFDVPFLNRFLVHTSTLAWNSEVILIYSGVMLFLFYWNLRLRVPPFKVSRSPDGEETDQISI